MPLRKDLQLYGPVTLQMLPLRCTSGKPSCIGRSFPYYRDCLKSIDIESDAFKLAFQDLTILLREGLQNHQNSLVDKLRSIARAFSCHNHQNKSSHVNQFAYYWLAMNSLPHLLSCMGFVLAFSDRIRLPPNVTEKCEVPDCRPKPHCVHRTQAMVDRLDSEEVWLLHSAVNRLKSRRWMPIEEDSDGSQQLRYILEARCRSIFASEEEKVKRLSAESRWKSWHEHSDLLKLTAFNANCASSSKTDKYGGEESEDENNSENASEQSFDSNVERVATGQIHPENICSNITDIKIINKKPFGQGKSAGRSDSLSNSSKERPSTPKRPRIKDGGDGFLSPPKVLQQSHASKETSSSNGSSSSALRTSSSPQTRSSSESPSNLFKKEKHTLRNFNRLNNVVLDLTEDDTASGLWVNRPKRRRARQSDQEGQDHTSRFPSIEENFQGSTLSSHARVSGTSGEQSSNTCETLHETLPGSIVTGEKAQSPQSDLNFFPFHPKPERILETTYEVFRVMKRPLSDKKDLDEGYVYTLRMVERPGYLKIGRTTVDIEKRRKQINSCIKYQLEAANDADLCSVSNHTRVETLVHKELRNYRRAFPCGCKKKAKNRKCDGLNMHGEWFFIDEAKAFEAIERWRKWMSTDPYCDGSLRNSEQLRIAFYLKTRIS